MTRGNRRFQGRAPLAGDDWLKANMPPLISFANAHAGVIFITWDEGSGTNKMPFLAVGPGVGSKDRQHVLANRRGVRLRRGAGRHRPSLRRVRRLSCGRGGIRTHYPRLRRPVLYPDELRARNDCDCGRQPSTAYLQLSEPPLIVHFMFGASLDEPAP
jgi:hypothetical protein